MNSLYSDFLPQSFVVLCLVRKHNSLKALTVSSVFENLSRKIRFKCGTVSHKEVNSRVLQARRAIMWTAPDGAKAVGSIPIYKVNCWRQLQRVHLFKNSLFLSNEKALDPKVRLQRLYNLLGSIPTLWIEYYAFPVLSNKSVFSLPGALTNLLFLT